MILLLLMRFIIFLHLPPILNYFKPKILLGLTATPERMDGENILDDFVVVLLLKLDFRKL
jgi:superfamily II DNA or RNA helicase